MFKDRKLKGTGTENDLTGGDFNHLVSASVSGVATCIRSQASFKYDLKKFPVNLISLGLHFFMRP